MIEKQTPNNHETANGAYGVLTAGNFKPILFSTPMVQAILRGEKTQTRRIMQEQPPCQLLSCGTSGRYWADNPEDLRAKYFRCKYEIGDILWVRETWQHAKCLNINPEDENYGFVYKADGQPWEDYEHWTWKPSIFMPKEAARIFLKITNIRVDRLNDISESDAVAEGIVMNNTPHIGWYWMENVYSTDSPIMAYERLWQKINGEKSWAENPFVWVYAFERTDAYFACS
ncbi:MAG: hypothetical protein WC389_16385 [Lutibacter sp.]|jgi:hypothetical protein